MFHWSRRSCRLGSLLLGMGMVCGGVLRAAEPTVEELAATIDRQVAERCASAGIDPAPLTSDETYLRRTYLDLVGRIPTVAEARAFLDENAADKRRRLVGRLVDSPAHAEHMAVFWRRVWVPQLDSPHFASLLEGFHQWLTLRLDQQTPYDQIVRELLDVDLRQAASGCGADGVPTPRAFMAVGEFKPELLAANMSRAFLGVNLECAQCHNHPFARWTRKQFWQTAAFFARPSEDETTPVRLELRIPDSDERVAPALLTSGELDWPEALDADSGRAALAEWLTHDDNPYLARNAVNRLWSHFFGVGLVEPLDDLTDENPASHPELLEALATALVSSNFDLRHMAQAIASSQTYQRASKANDSTADERLFASIMVRGLTGEQLYDSLHVAAGLPLDRNAPKALARRQFVSEFHSPHPGTAERSIVQALALMNGPLTAQLSQSEASSTLAAVAEAPFLDTQAKVEALVLATYSRRPTPAERESLVAYVERQARDRGMRQPLADVFWALLNSSEFNSNH